MKKLVIVCDDKHRKYGDFLAQLVSLDDDTEDRVVGTKDGSVAAVVWSEKHYQDNASTVSSDQYILFIGNGKLAKDKRSHMEVKFEHFGMRYGWLGKQGNLSVGDPVDIEEYDDFYEFAINKQQKITRLIEQKDSASEDSNLPVEAKENKRGLKLFDGIKKFPEMGLVAIKKLASRDKIIDQQYSCLTYEFYLNGLSEFLGLE